MPSAYYKQEAPQTARPAAAEGQPPRLQVTARTPQMQKAMYARERKKRKVKHIITSCIFYLLCACILGGAVLFAFSSNPEKSLFGYRMYTVLTDSMTPGVNDQPGGFYKGDVIITQIVDPATLSVGDIVTFVPGEDTTAYLTHRLVDIQETLNGQQGPFYTTRGDTNNADDVPIQGDRIIGKKVFAIPKLGTAMTFVQENFIPVILMVLAAFVLIFVARMWMGEKKNKRKQAARANFKRSA